MAHAPIPPMPTSPQVGEVYKHYKGTAYKVVGFALDPDDRWDVVYEPQDKKPDSIWFTRPAAEWRELVEWEGQKVERFTLQP